MHWVVALMLTIDFKKITVTTISWENWDFQIVMEETLVHGLTWKTVT